MQYRRERREKIGEGAGNNTDKLLAKHFKWEPHFEDVFIILTWMIFITRSELWSFNLRDFA